MAASRMWFANLSPSDAIKMKTGKICCCSKYAQQMFFWIHYSVSHPSLFMDLGANNMSVSQQLWILSQHDFLVFLPVKRQKTLATANS